MMLENITDRTLATTVFGAGGTLFAALAVVGLSSRTPAIGVISGIYAAGIYFLGYRMCAELSTEIVKRRD